MRILGILLTQNQLIMTTTKKFWYYAFVLIGATFMLFSSCEKDDDDNKSIPVISTTEITVITQTTAKSGGNITDDGGATVTARGVCWSTGQDQTQTISDSKTVDGAGAGNFTSSITGLEPNTMYYVRAYATNSKGTGYGNALSFTTLEDQHVPVLSTTEITEITQTTAKSGGNITDVGGVIVAVRGVCWSTSQDPTISDSKTQDGDGAWYYGYGTGNFTSSISGLEPNTMYYVRAYATNSKGTGYGNALSFTTEGQYIPILSTTEITEITQTTAKSGGNITDDGGATVTARGVCWSTSQDPTISDSKTQDGAGAGNFTSSISGLEPNTIYYVRAYATNSKGTGYGNALLFTTLDQHIPILSTTEITGITQTTAKSGGNITDEGGATVTARGVCWSTSQDPTISDSKTQDGAGAGNFISSISGLEPNTMYYVRAYATNSKGTGYGNALSFTTLEEVTDADGNGYSTVVIGNKEWFAENLKTTKYNDGTPIPNVTDGAAWDTLTTGAYAWYENNESTYKNAYGALYNWYAVNTGKLCPTGWHVPTDAEWTTLINYAGGESVAAGKLKSTRTAPDAHPRWDDPNTTATDEYGFSALPGGYRYGYGGFFYSVGNYGRWWSSTETDATYAWGRYMHYGYGPVYRNGYGKRDGFSVRCLRDN